MPAAAAPAPGPGCLRVGEPDGRRVLAATVLGSSMVFLDGTVVTVALPRMGEELGADFVALQWIANGYLLALASLILVGGALGDRYGRRRMFVVGAAWFAVASAVCGLAPGTGWLVAGRVLQGVGGALLTPASLAILQATFHPDERARAIGIWSGWSGLSTAVGPFLGGWLVQAASWRWVFGLNLPVAAVVAVLARGVPETRAQPPLPPLDVAGALAATVGLAGLSAGLVERSWVLATVGVASLVVFAAVEARVGAPMVPLRIFRSRPFSAANASTLVVYGALGGVLFFLSIVLQSGLGYPPLAAGAATVPITLLLLAGSGRAGALAQRAGPRLPMTAGPATMALGLVALSTLAPGASYLTAVLPGLVVFGVGLTLTVAPLTATVLAGAPTDLAGVASGVNNAVARSAGLLAVAAVPLVAGFDPTVAQAPDALVAAFGPVARWGAVACAAGAAIAWAFVPSTMPGGADPQSPGAPAPSGEGT